MTTAFGTVRGPVQEAHAGGTLGGAALDNRVRFAACARQDGGFGSGLVLLRAAEQHTHPVPMQSLRSSMRRLCSLALRSAPS